MPWATKPFPNDSRSLYPQSIINKNKIIHTVKNLKTKPKVTRHLGRSVLWSAVTHKSQLRLFYKIWATPEHRFQEDTAANTIQGGFSWTVLQHRQTQAHLVSVAPWQSYDFGCQCYGQKGTLQAQRCAQRSFVWRKNVKHSPRKHSLTGQTLRQEHHGLGSLFHRWTQMNLLKVEGIIKLDRHSSSTLGQQWTV